MICIQNISKTYKDANEIHLILDQLYLDIELGSSISIQGASGSGKSTLLHILAALDKPNSGSVKLPGKLAEAIGRDDLVKFSEHQANQYRKQFIGIIFQKFNLIDCISVKDNIFLPAKLNGKVDLAYIDELSNMLGIKQHYHKVPNQLSGGEQQRVAIARALAHKPMLLLADEPTGNLDTVNSDIVSHLLINTCKNLGTTLVLVTHSKELALLTERQFSLSNRQLLAISSLNKPPIKQNSAIV